LKGKPIASIEDLKKQITEFEKEKSLNEKLLPIAKNLEKHQNDLEEIKKKIKAVADKLEKLKQLPTLEKELESIKMEFENLLKQKEQSTKEIKLLEEEIRKLSETIERTNTEIIQKEQRISDIQKWKVELEQFGIPPKEYQSKDSLDNIYANIKRNFQEREQIKNDKYRLFEKLKNRTERFEADENEFIRYIESELVTIDDKQ